MAKMDDIIVRVVIDGEDYKKRAEIAEAKLDRIKALTFGPHRREPVILVESLRVAMDEDE